jgi:hypothetical protein
LEKLWEVVWRSSGAVMGMWWWGSDAEWWSDLEWWGTGGEVVEKSWCDGGE